MIESDSLTVISEKCRNLTRLSIRNVSMIALVKGLGSCRGLTYLVLTLFHLDNSLSKELSNLSQLRILNLGSVTIESPHVLGSALSATNIEFLEIVAPESVASVRSILDQLKLKHLRIASVSTLRFWLFYAMFRQKREFRNPLSYSVFTDGSNININGEICH